MFIWVAVWQHTCMVELISTGDGQIMEKLYIYNNKTVCVGCMEKNISCIFRYSFLCLCCVVSVHYRLCFVTVCMKILKNGRLQTFKEDRLLVCI